MPVYRVVVLNRVERVVLNTAQNIARVVLGAPAQQVSRVVVSNKPERVVVHPARNIARVVLGVQGPPGTSENIDCGTF